MKGNICKVCGFVALGDAPDNCPVCGAPKASFELKEDALKTPQDPANLEEAEKKHMPQITVVKQCGLIPDGCIDVHAKVGEIQHPMQQDHYIVDIDFYIDNEFIARTKLTPEKLNPCAALHLKQDSGKLQVISHCNLHGSWISETDI